MLSITPGCPVLGMEVFSGIFRSAYASDIIYMLTCGRDATSSEIVLIIPTPSLLVPEFG